ncbi:serine hydrolase domain-containing protein [Pyxidicoccus sp. 3LG]
MSNELRLLVVSLGVMLCACGGSEAPVPEEASPSDADAAKPLTDSGPSPSLASPWDAVTAVLEARAAEAGNPGVGLVIYDDQDRKVYERMVGNFTPDRRVAVASSSKMVSAAVIFEVIRQGHLTLNSTTGQVLGWTGAKANITLRHLLSFTSGMPPDHACLGQSNITLAQCVAAIATAPQFAAPGTRYDYGGTHLQVAARMAEVATGKTWNTLFAETLATPLNLPPGVSYFTAPRFASGTTNPLVGGGLRASMNEYSKLLALIYHRGRYAGLERGTLLLFAAQTREPFPNVIVGNSPAQGLGYPFRYGLGAWLECGTPATGCDVISSPGAFGWTPWVDRSANYYAILGMELGVQDVNGGITEFSMSLEQELQPLILTALGLR